MNNKNILSNQSGYAPDLVLRQSRPASVSLASRLRVLPIFLLFLIIGSGNVWGDPTVLFHETFGNNTGSARAWNNTYSVKSGVSAVYSGITGYTVSNCKQGKNTTGSTQSGLNQTTQGTDAYIIIGPLSVASYSSLGVTYQWKAGSIKGTYTTKLYYATSSGGSYTEVSGTGTGATSFVERSYSLPVAAQVSTLYLKIVWNTSNTQAIIDEVELTGTAAAGSVSTPTFSVAEGTYNSNQSVTISCATAGSTIYYTTDGSTPTSSSTAYSSAVAINSTTTLKAIAIKGGTSSSVASATYTLKCATPTFSPAAGTYTSVQSVSISTTYGTNIYYTTDGSTPTTSSTLYSSAISVSSSQTIKAIAVKSGCSDSDVGEAAYTINIPYTVSFSTGIGNPLQGNISEASAGAGITLPAGPTPSCSSDGWSFAGWGYASCDDESTEPTLYIAGNKYYPSSNETLYAVYVKGKTASTNYKLISDAAQIVSGENYVIAAYYNSNDYAITAEIQSSYYIKQTAVTVTENAISSPGAKIIWQLTNEGGSNVSLYNSNQSKYLYVYASSSYRNLGLYDSKKQFTMTEEREAGYASTFAFNSTDYTSYYINYDASHTDFGTKTSSDENLYLYKRQYTGTYESNPTCCTDPELAYATGSVTKTFGNGTFKNTLTNSHSVSVTYESSNTDVATVASDGTVTIQGAGNATITARFAGNSTYCADEASYTLTVNKASISPTLTYSPASVAVGENSATPTVGGNTGNGTVTYAITSIDPAGCASINTSTGIVTGVAVGSVTVTATVAATTNYNGGSATANVTISAASGYCISAFNSSNDGITSGFSNGGSGNEYTLSYTIPGKDGSSNWPQYWIGENEAYQSFSASANFADMHVTTCDATIGLAEGATGRLHIWDNNKADGSNLWVKFEPSGYGLRWGGADWSQAANTKAFTVDAGDANVYWTDIVTLDGTNNTTWNYYVGLQTASGYVYSGVDNEASDSRGISRTRSVTAMKVSNGTAGSWKGTYLSSEPTGSRGKFRIWNNNIDDYNFYCHWVPFYRVTYDGSGASGSTAASADVCCEGNAAARTVVAAANGFTIPTGKTFGGWASSSENAAAGVVAYAAGANVVLTSSITLYAIWTDINYTVTVNQNPSVGATTTGQTTTAHYNGTINLTTTVPSGYRFVNWTTSDEFSITNPTSATTASFTMPAKNVTVTANFQQTHTVDWYVGGSAPANKIGDDGQTTVVDHGGKISAFPATTPDGSACDKVFVGWTNTTSYTHGTSLLFTDVAGSPTINANASFYAVFAEGGNTEYVLTPAASLTAGEYVIAAYDDANSKYLALTGAVSAASLGSNSDMVNETTGFTISEGKFTTLPTGACEFVLTAYTGETDNGFYIQNPADDKYLDYQTTTNRRLWFYAATDYEDGGVPTTPWAAWYGVALPKDGFPDNGMYLKYVDETYSLMSNGSGTTFVRGYANDNTKYKPIYLFKKTGGATGHTINCADCGSSVTPTYTAAPTGGTVSVTKSASPVTSGSTVKTCTAVDLTVTITPASHYTLTGFTATGLTTGTATISPAVNTVVPTTSAQTFTVTVSAGATGTLNLTPTFTAETPLTITFDVSSVSGVTAGSIGTIYSGDDFDFPNVSGVPVGFCAEFLGWVDATNGTTFDGDGTTTTEPAELIEVGDNSGAITTNKTYKAVYGESETSEMEAYFKVTSTPADWEDDHYLIVYEDGNVAFDGSLSTLDAVENTVDVTITSGVIAYSSALAASEFRIAEITDGYSIQSASGFYIGQTSNANGMATNSSDAYANALAISSGDFDATSSSAHLRFNSASNQLRFRYYKSASFAGQNAVQLYKLGTDNVVTYTYTTAPSCGDKYRVTVASVTGGSPSASPKYCADGTTISLVANPANGYSFTSWTITKDADDSNVTTTLLGDNSTTASTSFTMPAYDVTVTAAYSITNYNITYNNLNGATNSNPATYNVASADIEFVAPGARAGYIFKGWYDDAVYTNQVTGIPNGSTGAVTVYAKWAVGHTITWDNAIGVNPASTGVEDGQAIGTLPTPTGSCTFDGTTYSNFVGWYTGTISSVGTAASDAGTEITAATVPTANATYHAVYTNMPDYSGTNTSNVTLPASPSTPVSTAKIKVSSEDDAPEYDGIKIGTSKNKTGSFTFTVPSGTTKITLHGVAWSGKTASVTLATSVGTISPSTAQPLDDNSGASDNSPFTITSNTTLTFNLANVSSEATITVSNSSERVIVWGINASSASGSDVGYITSCCDNLLAAPTMNSPTVRTSTAITLSWNTVPNATGYKVSWNGGDWEDVGTATTYEKTSLEPGNDYSYKVIAKYTSPYCGASAYEGVVSTKPVYSVTYERGSGTGSCSATGSIPAVAYYEEGATVSLAASNTFSLSGNTFDAWSSEQVALTASSTSFTMPAEDVIITATWMANVDKFYDRMHNLTSGEGSHTDAQGKHYITREGCNYTVPALEDNTDGETACHTSHYVLLGWIAGGHLDSEGKVKSGEESYIFTGGGTKTAGGNTYYAVWAEVTE